MTDLSAIITAFILQLSKEDNSLVCRSTQETVLVDIRHQQLILTTHHGLYYLDEVTKDTYKGDSLHLQVTSPMEFTLNTAKRQELYKCTPKH